MQLDGVYVALVTPFTEQGAVDHDTLRALCTWLIDSGVDGLVPCGTTGESATLSHTEHIDVIRTVVDVASGRVPVIAGTGSNATAEAVRLTREAADAGADAALLIAPYYNKPTQEGLYRHFATIADEVDLPQILYNIPGRTAVSMSAETIGRLAEHDRIVGIKEATGDLGFATDVIRRCPDDFVVLAGDDGLTLPLYAIGGRGVISVVAQVCPVAMLGLRDAWRNGDFREARRLHHHLQPLIAAMFIETNPGPVKEAMYMLGHLPNPELRLPLVRPDVVHRSLIRDALFAAGLEPER